MLLVKENHIAAAGSLEGAVEKALAAAAGRAVEVEVRTHDELRRALSLPVSRVMLDHWSAAQVRRAVELRGASPPPELEVSGNLSLERIAEFAIPGVQFLSVGALTHSAPALDFSMLFEGVGGGRC
jgi:nicotinate-nucleotide pyrophosphorylase (carboxylating)